MQKCASIKINLGIKIDVDGNIRGVIVSNDVTFFYRLLNYLLRSAAIEYLFLPRELNHRYVS